MTTAFRLLLVAFVALSVVHLLRATEEDVDKDFFFACSGGNVDQVWAFLQEHPGKMAASACFSVKKTDLFSCMIYLLLHADWKDATTPEGESCLHLAAIPGSEAVTKLLLEAGANPNVRTTFQGGLRMHPLSWNVYGGHYENIKLLLEYGAQVNADVDSGDGSIITVLDVNKKFLEANSNGEADPHRERFERVQRLLLENGAKSYEELKIDL